MNNDITAGDGGTPAIRQALDLQREAEALEQGTSEGARGFHSTTLLRGPLTLILFVFDAGASLLEHKAPGDITIHVLSGALTVQSEGQAHELHASQVLALPPGVRHSVNAGEASRMLLTIRASGG